MSTSRHIGVHYDCLEGGGAPKIVRDQIAYLLNNGHKVTFITLDDPDKVLLQHENFQAVRLELPDPESPNGFVGRNLGLRRNLRELRLELLISHSVRHGIRLGVLALGLPMRQIIVDHAHPPTTLSLLSRTQHFGLRYLLKSTQTLCVSEGASNSCSDLIKRPVDYIYNYAPDEKTASIYRGLPRANTIVALGRFASEKQFEILIEAFDRIGRAHPDWALHFYGGGERELALRERAGVSPFSERIHFKGWSDDPLRCLGRAGIVAQTSRYEGFGLTLVEAMAVGTPVVSFDCPFGPSEIISNNVNGLLVEDQSVEALAVALGKLISSQDLRKSLGSAAIEVTKRFSRQKHLDKWSKVIGSTVNTG